MTEPYSTKPRVYTPFGIKAYIGVQKANVRTFIFVSHPLIYKLCNCLKCAQMIMGNTCVYFINMHLSRIWYFLQDILIDYQEKNCLSPAKSSNQSYYNQ